MKDTRSYKGNCKQEKYGFASWNIATPEEKHYGKYGNLKAAREHYVEDAYITPENWQRLLDGETVQSVDDANYVYALAWIGEKIYPAFY
jgi:hypothetical protein